MTMRKPTTTSSATKGLVGKGLRFRAWMASPPRGAPPGVWANEAAAQRAVEYFERFLTHVKGEWAGPPMVLEPWEAERIICPMFGWYKADGTRLIHTVYVEIP